MKCDKCGEEKEDVEERNDPYMEEIHNIIEKYLYCDECYHNDLMEI